MDIQRFITKEDFLKLKPYVEGGILIDGRRYSAMSVRGRLSVENQIKGLGDANKTGEGIIDTVFFFEVIRDPTKEFWNEESDVIFLIVSAKIVDRYRYVSEQEACKEMALIRAKIVLRNKEILSKDDKIEGERNGQKE